MDDKRIVEQMHKLEAKINYKFRDIRYLSMAMGAIKVKVKNSGKHNREYKNEGLAVVGDAILRFVLADFLYKSGITSKGKITTEKSRIESNATMTKLINGEKLIQFAYNDLHFYNDKNIPAHEKVIYNKHTPYLEAIIGAVYYDSDFETAKKWILKWVKPTLEKYV